jgi:hypothetical protein
MVIPLNVVLHLASKEHGSNASVIEYQDLMIMAYESTHELDYANSQLYPSAVPYHLYHSMPDGLDTHFETIVVLQGHKSHAHTYIPHHVRFNYTASSAVETQSGS